MTQQTLSYHDQEKNNRHEGTVFMLYAIVTVIVYVLPVTKLLVPYVLAAMLMLVSVPLILLVEKDARTACVLLCAFSAIQILLYFLAGASLVESINEGIRNIRFFLPALWGFYLLRHCDRKKCSIALWIFGIMAAFILYQTLIALTQEPWITRLLAQGTHNHDAALNAYRLRNVGGFEFSYALGFVVLCMLWTAFEVKRKRVKLLLLVSIVVSLYYIIQTMYTTLLILTVVGILVVIFLRIKHPVVRLFLVIGGFVVVFALEPLFAFVSTLFSDESLLSTKFEQISEALGGGDIDAMGGRFRYMLDSLDRWSQNPILGKIDNRFSGHTHSLLVSTLENTGLVGISLLFGLFYVSYRLIADELKKSGIDHTLFRVAIVYVLAHAFFNPIGYVFEMTIMAFFIVPIWLKIMTKNEEIKSI